MKKSGSSDWSWKPEKADRKLMSHGNKVIREAWKAIASTYRPAEVSHEVEKTGR